MEEADAPLLPDLARLSRKESLEIRAAVEEGLTDPGDLAVPHLRQLVLDPGLATYVMQYLRVADPALDGSGELAIAVAEVLGDLGTRARPALDALRRAAASEDEARAAAARDALAKIEGAGGTNRSSQRKQQASPPPTRPDA